MRLNGREVQAEEGRTVLEVARENGADIPTLCHHPALEAYGGCRLCVVEAKAGKRSRLVTSCNYEVGEGLEVQTDSPRVRKSRRLTVELLLSRCPQAAVLQKLAGRYGLERPRFPAETEDCILCGLCVRICRERMGVGAADFVGRGAEIKVDTPYHRGSPVCLTCGACVSVCPTGSIRLATVFEKAPVAQGSEFEQGLAARPTIYIPFPQALPNVPVIDRSNCVHFRTGACGICREACPAGAIDYGQEDRVEVVEAGAVILSPGFCLYDAAQRPELGYSSWPNVVSSLQFERILSASGPYMGKVLRPSDLAKPRRLAFIQCVGSRDHVHDYCSSVCCMYAVKEAIMAKEHEEDIDCEIFYMDIRAHGKGFDAYFERAKQLGIRFTRCRPARVEQIEGSRSLRIGYTAEDGAYHRREFDLVVLSAGLQPPAEHRELAARFGVELDADGFAVTRPFEPVATSREGVYVCGPFSEPKDIPETVVEASSASSRAMVQLAAARGTRVSKKELPPERSVAGEPPRIGVFVCHCGKNIGGIVDVPSVAEYARGLSHVAYAADNLYTCSSDTQAAIKEKIREHGLNRVVVASCSPRTHEPLFQQTIREAGLNPHLFEMANIRDQCSWVHMHQKEQATAKARDLVRMAVANAALTEPLASIPLPVTPRALVVGGGLAGMTAALNLADQGFEVVLVEKSERLGGNALRLDRTAEGHDVRRHARELADRLAAHPKARVLTGARLVKVDGFIGNFTSTVEVADAGGNGGRQEVRVEHGVAILATGAAESRPAEYGYGRSGRVRTLLELEEALAGGTFSVPDTVVMIQCVGSREPDHLYCSRVCCTAAVKNAIRMKRANPRAAIFILYREMRTYGFREKLYGEARELGIHFVRYELDGKPEVSLEGERVTVRVVDPILEAELEIPADLLVLASRIEPNPDNAELSQAFKVPLNADRFFLEAHVKLRPVEFATDGVYVCGLAHYPKDAREAVAQAMAAAGRAATVLSRETIEAEGKISYVNEARCRGCGTCLPVCAYNGITLDEARGVAVINEAVCKGCGACAAACRGSAIRLRGFRDEQILSVLNVV
jgi:heterodisulfide reductase subunit A